MKLSGSQRIEAPKQRVWEALNDPEILRQSIPGCQSLEKEADDRFRATAVIKIGPMDARFAGAVTLSDLDPPNAYTISGEGQGGAAGFAKGNARVQLADEGAATLLTYDVDVNVGGRLAQLGGPIIDATAKQLANSFFKRFGEVVAPQAAAPVPGAAAVQGVAGASAPASVGGLGASGFPMVWLLTTLVAFLAGFLFAGDAQGGASPWSGVAIALLIIVVAGAAFEFGRKSGTPVITIDDAVLKRLTGREKQP